MGACFCNELAVKFADEGHKAGWCTQRRVGVLFEILVSIATNGDKARIRRYIIGVNGEELGRGCREGKRRSWLLLNWRRDGGC